MIKIVASGKIKADKLGELAEVVKPLVYGSRGEEGNISYSLNQSTEDPTEVAFIEEWKDQEAIDIHNQTDHFKVGIAKLADLLDGGFAIKLYKPFV